MRRQPCIPHSAYPCSIEEKEPPIIEANGEKGYTGVNWKIKVISFKGRRIYYQFMNEPLFNDPNTLLFPPPCKAPNP